MPYKPEFRARLDALRALESATTPGPWYSNVDDLIGGNCVGTKEGMHSEVRGADSIVSMGAWNNTAFIAAARNALPELIAFALHVLDEREGDHRYTPDPDEPAVRGLGWCYSHGKWCGAHG